MTRKINNKDDRRVKRTKKSIREAFLSLLEQKDYDQITVTDIIEKADYNRATFYRHYHDKAELVDEIVEQQIELLIEAILQPLKNKKTVNIQSLKPEEITLFNHVMEEIEFYKLWHKFKTIPNVTNKFIDALKHLHSNNIELMTSVENIDKNVYTEFYVYGIVGILFTWIENDFREPPSFMAEQLWNVLSSPPKQLCISIHDDGPQQ